MRIMDRQVVGTVAAATAVAVAGLSGLYALHQYRTKKRLYVLLNLPVFGAFTRLRNFVYRNTVQDRLWNYVESRSEAGNPESVMAAFDDYCYNYEWTWSIGDEKAEVLSKVLQEASPSRCLELGSFCGYSAVVIAHNMAPNGKLVTVEKNPKSAEIARKIIDRAGFSDRVTVVNASSHEVIPEIPTEYNMKSLDFVFMDHFGSRYEPDLKLIEELGLLHTGSVIQADNIKNTRNWSGSQTFLNYVRNSGKYECRHYPGTIEYTKDLPDGMERAIYKGIDA